MATREGQASGGRLAAANRAADAKPAKVGATVQPCPLSCENCWKKVNDERDKIANISNPEARNKKISAAYASMYEQDKSLTWIGLAAIVSRQAGCAMQYADQTNAQASQALERDDESLKSPFMSDGGEGGTGVDMMIRSRQLDSSATAKEALGAANKEIFSTMYPAVRFRELYGMQKLKECNIDANGKRRIPPKLMTALENLSSSDPSRVREASNQMARYEQQDVVQGSIYQVQRYNDVLVDNENYSSWKRLWVGRLFGARPAQIPLSSNCSGKEIGFDGSITSADDRISYYGKLVGAFSGETQAWRDQTMSEIVQQGK